MDNNFFSRFMPKNDEYFKLLDEMADSVQTTAELTFDCINAQTREDIIEYTVKIREQKKTGLVLQGKISRELHNSFVTPFDREDINALAVNMKDVIDHISGCAKRIMMYEPREIPQDLKKMAELIKEAAGTIKIVISKLNEIKKNPQNITHLCKKIDSIENETDEIYENFLIRLFKNEKDPIEIIKLKDIFFELESAADSAEHVSKSVGTIIVKYA